VVAALLLAKVVVAQATAVVDEGTFSVTEKGAPIGRESFRISRTPAPNGQVFLVTGLSALHDTNRVFTTLGTDSLGVPVSYFSEHRAGGHLVQSIHGRGRPGRLSIVKQTLTGGSGREYLLNHRALLIDEDVFHHFFFVPTAVGNPHLIVIAPRPAQQDTFTVEDRGVETVEIAGRGLSGRRYTLVSSAKGARDVWIDAKGRLLKVAIAARGLVALRDDPPR
jgi:hypothetical protein